MAKSNKGVTGLMEAAYSGSAEAVRAVLALGKTELEAKDKYGRTAFHAACHKGDPECIAELIKAEG